MTQVIVTLHSNENVNIILTNENRSINHVKQIIQEKTNLPFEHQEFRNKRGSRLQDNHVFDLTESLYFLDMTSRVFGGKGGFGSMLRAQGGRMNAQKTTNFEACRDLQGRRIRTVNEAKKIQEQEELAIQQEEVKKEKIKKKIEDGLKEREKRKFLFDDNQFLEDKEDIVENVKSAVSDALKRRKLNEKPTSTSPPASSSASSAASLFDDDISDSEDDEEEESEEEKDIKGKGKAK